jgi:hypothetical protein
MRGKKFSFPIVTKRRQTGGFPKPTASIALARHFFEILSCCRRKHIVHDTAIGLQLPESNNENQWIYVARDGEKVGDFVRLMDNLFAPFNKISLSELHGRADAKAGNQAHGRPHAGLRRSFKFRVRSILPQSCALRRALSGLHPAMLILRKTALTKATHFISTIAKTAVTASMTGSKISAVMIMAVP